MTTMGMVSGFESLVLVGTIRLDSGWSANRSVLALSYWQTTTTHRSRRTICDRCCTSSGCGCCYGGSCSWGCSWCPGAGRPGRGGLCARCNETASVKPLCWFQSSFDQTLLALARRLAASPQRFWCCLASRSGSAPGTRPLITADHVILDCIVQYIFALMHILSSLCLRGAARPWTLEHSVRRGKDVNRTLLIHMRRHQSCKIVSPLHEPNSSKHQDKATTNEANGETDRPCGQSPSTGNLRRRLG
jgi:hypothetical protein